MKKDEAFEKLKGLFTADLKDKIKTLNGVIVGNPPVNGACDWETVAQIAHQIKGTARSFGYSEISMVADELERSVAKRSLEYSTSLVKKISDLSPDDL
ncbi:MAG: Hpt domain-containing protein [Candidatus Kryptoniota bacterium]